MLDNNVLHNNTANPLVSIVVITYNSSQTVIETLESIKAQTYDNLELIVSDDCSQDNTIEVVSQWIADNKYRFVHTGLITTEKNTGVSGNLRRGIAPSKGEWIKSIAGDDLLIPTCIQEYVDFVNNNPENVRMCVCNVECFTTYGEIDEKTKENVCRNFEKACEIYPQQKKRIVHELVFSGPTFFYSRELYNEIGGFKDKYGCAEEWPFVYEIIRNGNQIYTIDKKLVRYRVQSSSISHQIYMYGLPNKRSFEGGARFFFEKRFFGLIIAGHPLTAWHQALWYWNVKCMYHIKNKYLRELVKKGMMMFSPLSYLLFIKRVHLKKSDSPTA